VVVTSLTNHAMPLIRYRIGDTGSSVGVRCSCGRSWPLLEAVSGRVSDHFVTLSGARIHGNYFVDSHGVAPMGIIRKYQIVQEEPDLIRYRIVLWEPVEQPHQQYGSELARIRQRIRAAMGEECRVEFEFVDEIEASGSGKHRYTISRLQREP